MGAGDNFGSDFSDTDSGVTDSYDESGIDDNTSDASDFTESADDNADLGESVDAEMTTADEPVGDPLLTESVKKFRKLIQIQKQTQLRKQSEIILESRRTHMFTSVNRSMFFHIINIQSLEPFLM